MATVLEVYTTEEQRSVVRFYGQKDSIQMIFIKKCFLFIVWSVCRIKRLTIGSRISLKDVRKSQMMPAQVRKWLRQQSEDFYAAGFDALLKRWDKCINVNRRYVEKWMFFPGASITYLTFYIHLWPIYWLSLVYLLPASGDAVHLTMNTSPSLTNALWHYGWVACTARIITPWCRMYLEIMLDVLAWLVQNWFLNMPLLTHI
jgi:hypothetical protein